MKILILQASPRANGTSAPFMAGKEGCRPPTQTDRRHDVRGNGVVLGTDLGLFQKSFSQSMNSKSVGRLIP